MTVGMLGSYLKSALEAMSFLSAPSRIPLYTVPVLKVTGGVLSKLFSTTTSMGTELRSKLWAIWWKKREVFWYPVKMKIIWNEELWISVKLTFSPRKQQQQCCREQSRHRHHGRWTGDWADCELTVTLLFQSSLFTHSSGVNLSWS